MKRCPDDGSLRAYLDQELNAAEEARLVAHLQGCYQCEATIQRLQADADLVSRKLATLNCGPESAAMSPTRALARFRQRREEERVASAKHLLWERIGAQMKGLFSAGWKVGAGVAVALCLVAVVSVAPVRLAAEGLLSQFRVQTFTAVTVDPTQLPEPPRPDQLGKLEVQGSPQVHRDVTLSQAQGMVSFKLKTPAYLPAGVPTDPRLMASDEGRFTYTIDGGKLQAYLQSIGAGDIQLGADVGGSVISGHVPPMVIAIYSAQPSRDVVAEPEPGSSAASTAPTAKPSGPTVAVIQGQSPTFDVPDNLTALRDELLKSPALPEGLAQQLAAIQNWQSTVPVPVPSRADSHSVTVHGQPGGLVVSEGNATVVMWQENGIVYAVAGDVSEAELMKVAESLR